MFAFDFLTSKRRVKGERSYEDICTYSSHPDPVMKSDAMNLLN